MTGRNIRPNRRNGPSRDYSRDEYFTDIKSCALSQNPERLPADFKKLCPFFVIRLKPA